MRPSAVVFRATLLAGLGSLLWPGVSFSGQQIQGSSENSEIKHDESAPLSEIPPVAPKFGPPNEMRRHPQLQRQNGPDQSDTALQTAIRTPAAATAGLGFEGIGNGVYGYTVNSAPPDPNGAVGPSHYVQWVNTAFAVFSKSGALLKGPMAGNTLWSGFRGGCEFNNDGDPIVQYDKIADRWIFMQFSVTAPYPYSVCMAVSTTPDPTGTYYRYEFGGFGTEFPDYPKMGVWSDGYYVTYNLFNNGTTFTGPRFCSYDRSKMLTGVAATQQCFTLGSQFGGDLPSDFDGKTLPPAGSPNYVVEFGTNALSMWKFHVDWTTPANTTLTGPITIAVAPFSMACGGATCIPQVGTTQQLDSLADRVMYRLAYRNFGDHESLVTNHSVTAGSGVGVRWYEIRGPAGTPTIFQQGTYAPDSSFRWMGSVAMDRAGDIGVGYSISSSTIHPGIRFTGRLVTDPLNTLQAESVVFDGAGSQTGGLSRWGDYSAMSVDPSDDCTFWYTNEYIPGNGSFNWHTRISSFKFPSCGTPDFSVVASPASQSVVRGNSTSYTVTVTPSGGFTGTVTFSIAGVPTGASASFNPASVTTSGSSALTVTTSATTAAGSYPLTITGTSGTLSHTAMVTLVVTAPATPDFSLSASPASQTVVQGNGTSYAVTVTPSGGFTGTVTFSATGLPSGAGATFNPTSVTTSGSSTMTVTTSATTPAGSYPLTITGTSGTLSHTAAVTLVVTARPTPDYSLSASPASQTVVQGSGTSYSVTVTPSGGFTGTVTFNASGLPAGATASFNPTSVTTSGSSTMSVATVSTTPTGTFTLTITGTSGTLSHTTTVTLVVNPPAPAADFSLSASPASQSVPAGGRTTYTINIARTGGFAGGVTLSATGVPAGTTATFSPNPATGTSSTLTVSTSGTTPVNTYTITITGTSGTLSHKTSVSLVVTAGACNGDCNN